MSPQEAYERIRAYFSRPDAQLAKNDGGGCEYRSSIHNGPCAIGVLIPDELYTEALEHCGSLYGVVDAAQNAHLPEAIAVLEHLGLTDLLGPEDDQHELYLFLCQAQDAHDTQAVDATDFVRLLDATARELGGLKVVAAS